MADEKLDDYKFLVNRTDVLSLTENYDWEYAYIIRVLKLFKFEEQPRVGCMLNESKAKEIIAKFPPAKYKEQLMQRIIDIENKMKEK